MASPAAPGPAGADPATITLPAPSSAPAPAPTPSTATADMVAGDPNLRTCFICLLNSAETPGATWVNPCPCTLEAHEDCMLLWVAEYESNAHTATAASLKKGLRCPACNERIQVVEPYSPFVDACNRLRRIYSRASPVVLLSLVGTCSIAGSAWYGMLAMSVFAGPGAAIRWTGIMRALLEHRRVPWWRWGSGYNVALRFYLLHLIAPALLFHKAIPSLATLSFLPPGCLVSSYPMMPVRHCLPGPL